MLRNRCLVVLIVLVCVFILLAAIEPIKTETGISFNGQVVRDTTLAMTFKLYPSDSGGTALWSETYDTVSVKGEKFIVTLGEKNSFPEYFNPDSKYWLAIEIDTRETKRIEISLRPPKSKVQKKEIIEESGSKNDSLSNPKDEQTVYIGSGKDEKGFIWSNGCWRTFWPIPDFPTCYIRKNGNFILAPKETLPTVSGDNSSFSVKINDGEDVLIEPGSEVNLETSVSGGVRPFSYEWYEGQDTTIIGADSLYSLTSDTTKVYRVKVRDTNSDTTSAVINVKVLTP